MRPETVTTTMGINLKSVALVFAPVLIAGCDAWPPESAFLTEHFLNNRQSFVALERKLEASDYSEVAQEGILGIGRYSEPPQVVAWERSDDEDSDWIEITDDPEWYELLNEAGLFSVTERASGFSFSLWGLSWLHEGRFYYVSYIHDAGYRDRLMACQPEYQAIPCGFCAVDMPGHAWFLEYEWYPEHVLPPPENTEIDILNGPDEAYEQAYSEAFRECRVEGYRAIGYEHSEWLLD